MPLKPLGPAGRFASRFALLALGFYAALYFPYPPATLPARWLAAYVDAQAAVAGALVWLFDHDARVSGNLISGRFSLSIILDCAAVDAQALFAATVLAFPAAPRPKLIGLAVGLAAITVVNLLRIVILYFVGANWPDHFRFLHEDLFQFGIIAAAAAAFALWAWWASGPRRAVRAAA
jgi:exosortase/archaeosortase family protein